MASMSAYLTKSNFAEKLKHKMEMNAKGKNLYFLIDPISCKITFSNKPTAHTVSDTLCFCLKPTNPGYELTIVNNDCFLKMNSSLYGSVWITHISSHLHNAIRIAHGKHQGPYIPFNRENLAAELEARSKRPSSSTIITNRLPAIAESKEEKVVEQPEDAVGPSEPLTLTQLRTAAKTSATFDSLVSDLSADQMKRLLREAVEVLNTTDLQLKPSHVAEAVSYRPGHSSS